MKHSIRIKLSEKGQKADLLAGGSGKAVREIEIGQENLRAALDTGADVAPDGSVKIDLTRQPTTHVLAREGWRAGTRYPNDSSAIIRPSEEIQERAKEAGVYGVDCAANRVSVNLWTIAEESLSVHMFNRIPTAAEAIAVYAAQKKMGASVDDLRDECDRRNADLVEEFAEARAEADRCGEEYLERRLAERRESEKKEAEKQAAKNAADRERAEWIRANGTERLKMILEEDLIDGSNALYVEERLAKERPGWIFDSCWMDEKVEHREIRNPSLEALRALKEKKELGIDCELAWAHYGQRTDFDDTQGYDFDGNMVDLIREPILVSRFLGRCIVYRLNQKDGD